MFCTSALRQGNDTDLSIRNISSDKQFLLKLQKMSDRNVFFEHFEINSHFSIHNLFY